MNSIKAFAVVILLVTYLVHNISASPLAEVEIPNTVIDPEAGEPDVIDINKGPACNSVCNLLCRSRGWIGGFCANGNICYCYRAMN